MKRAAVVGDCLLDISIEHGPISSRGDRPARIRLSPGGQGANVAVRLARRGMEACLLSAWRDDQVGRLLREQLTAEGVALIPVVADRSGAVAVLLDDDGERTMLSDRVEIDGDALVAALDSLEDVGWFHVSGYALRDAAGETLADMLGRREPAIQLSVDGGSIAPEQATHFTERLTRCRPDLLIANREEAAALTGSDGHEPLLELAARLAADARVAVVTGGSDGSAAVHDTERIELPAPALSRPAFDGTGAGDAYTASLIAALHDSPWPPDASRLRGAMQAASAAGGEAATLHGAQARLSDE